MNIRIISQTNLSRINDVNNNALRLERLILHTSKKDSNKIISYLKDPGLYIRLQKLYEKFETNLEIEYAKQIINNSKNLLKNYLLYKRFVRLIKNEIKSASISQNDKVLFIGSGPFPISAMLFNQFVGCKIDCYEKEQDRVQLSRNVLSYLGFGKKIQVFTKKGEKLDTKKYTVIIIALLAKPKNKILNRIFKIARSGTKIISRTADGKRKGFYEETDKKLYKCYKVIGKIRAVGNQTISSVLLIK